MTLRIVHRTSGGSEQRGEQPGDDGDPCEAQNSHKTPHTLLSEGCVGALSVLRGAPTDTSIRDHGVLLSGSSLHGAAPLGLPWFCLVNLRESKEGSRVRGNFLRGCGLEHRARRSSPPERPAARRSTAQRDFGWCWTGVSGWGRT